MTYRVQPQVRFEGTPGSWHETEAKAIKQLQKHAVRMFFDKLNTTSLYAFADSVVENWTELKGIMEKYDGER